MVMRTSLQAPTPARLALVWVLCSKPAVNLTWLPLVGFVEYRFPMRELPHAFMEILLPTPVAHSSIISSFSEIL